MGVLQAAGDGPGGGVGDCDLAEFLAVNRLQVEGLEEFLGQVGGCTGEDVTKDWQLVSEGGVADGGTDVVTTGLQGGAFVVQFGVAGADTFS
jgi:hypothetical protein